MSKYVTAPLGFPMRWAELDNRGLDLERRLFEITWFETVAVDAPGARLVVYRGDVGFTEHVAKRVCRALYDGGDLVMVDGPRPDEQTIEEFRGDIDRSRPSYEWAHDELFARARETADVVATNNGHAPQAVFS